jgi:hypothetical protein
MAGIARYRLGIPDQVRFSRCLEPRGSSTRDGSCPRRTLLPPPDRACPKNTFKARRSVSRTSCAASLADIYGSPAADIAPHNDVPDSTVRSHRLSSIIDLLSDIQLVSSRRASTAASRSPVWLIRPLGIESFEAVVMPPDKTCCATGPDSPDRQSPFSVNASVLNQPETAPSSGFRCNDRITYRYPFYASSSVRTADSRSRMRKGLRKNRCSICWETK